MRVYFLGTGLLVVGLALAQDKPPLTPQQQESQDHLQQIGVAVQQYNEAERRLPMNISKDRRGLLSWRVALLPYLGQQALSKQFNLNEPWDSPENRRLLEKMPDVYRSGQGKAAAGQTYFQMFAGEGALLDPRKVYSLSTITDGLAQTILVIEAGPPVEWTKPADISFEMSKPLPKLTGPFEDRLNLVTCDGAVRVLRPDGPDFEKKLRAAITPAGNERITID
jgi:hypothetical protein